MADEAVAKRIDSAVKSRFLSAPPGGQFTTGAVSGLSEWHGANGVRLHQLRYRLQQERTGSADDTLSATWLRATVSELGVSLLVRVDETVIEMRPGFDHDLLSTKDATTINVEFTPVVPSMRSALTARI